MTAYIEYTVNQGATFKTQLQLRSDSGDGMNLIPYTLTGQVRRSYFSLNVSANIACTMIDAANGLLQLSITAANTANVKAGTYVYDVEARHAQTTEVVRVVEGMMLFTPEVTR